MERIRDGIYKIENVLIPNCVVDLNAADNKSVDGHTPNGGRNQEWQISRLGAGYSIRSVRNGNYVTVESGLSVGTSVVANPFPVSWVFEVYDCEDNVWKIGWPNSQLLFDMEENASHGRVQLRSDHAFSGSRGSLWRLVNLRSIGDGSDPLASTTTAGTIIDAEGLKLGGNGELAITTTTVTTAVVKVK